MCEGEGGEKDVWGGLLTQKLLIINELEVWDVAKPKSGLVGVVKELSEILIECLIVQVCVGNVRAEVCV